VKFDRRAALIATAIIFCVTVFFRAWIWEDQWAQYAVTATVIAIVWFSIYKGMRQEEPVHSGNWETLTDQQKIGRFRADETACLDTTHPFDREHIARVNAICDLAVIGAKAKP